MAETLAEKRRVILAGARSGKSVPMTADDIVRFASSIALPPHLAALKAPHTFQVPERNR